MIKKFDPAASLLAATSPAFAEKAGMMMIYGHGNTACAEYNTMPEHGRNMVGQWIDGFFTALSLVAAREGYDDGSPQKPLAMIAAVAAYCVENHRIQPGEFAREFVGPDAVVRDGKGKASAVGRAHAIGLIGLLRHPLKTPCWRFPQKRRRFQ